MSAERCLPTPDVPLRTAKMVARPTGEGGAFESQRSELVSEAHAQEMIDVFSKFKREGIEREVTLGSGWLAVYRKRKRGDEGDVTLKKEGEPHLRSTYDVRRRFGLPFDVKDD